MVVYTVKWDIFKWVFNYLSLTASILEVLFVYLSIWLFCDLYLSDESSHFQMNVIDCTFVLNVPKYLINTAFSLFVSQYLVCGFFRLSRILFHLFFFSHINRIFVTKLFSLRETGLHSRLILLQNCFHIWSFFFLLQMTIYDMGFYHW